MMKHRSAGEAARIWWVPEPLRLAPTRMTAGVPVAASSINVE
jgi:hypothetical protein